MSPRLGRDDAPAGPIVQGFAADPEARFGKSLHDRAQRSLVTAEAGAHPQ
jgi:hypothetical protein